MITYTTSKGISYFQEYKDARKIANTLIENGVAPNARIVSYGLGYAIQEKISAPCWNQDTKTFRS